jgi:hypothetical protein
MKESNNKERRGKKNETFVIDAKKFTSIAWAWAKKKIRFNMWYGRKKN